MVTLTGEKVKTWGGCGSPLPLPPSGWGGQGPSPFVTSLPGPQVDVHIMMQPPSGEWLYLDTLVTNSSGRVSYTIPETHRLGVGVYPIKMVVRYVPLGGEQARLATSGAGRRGSGGF